MSAPSELYNCLKKKVLANMQMELLTTETEELVTLITCHVLDAVHKMPVLWHPEEYKKPGYRARYDAAWNAFKTISPDIPSAFTLDRHMFYQRLIEQSLGTKTPRMKLEEAYAFLKQGAPTKYSDLIHLLNEEDSAREGELTAFVSSVEVVQVPEQEHIQATSVALELQNPRTAEEVIPIQTVKRERTKLSRGKASTRIVKPVTKKSANGAAPGTARRITQIPSESLLNWNQGLPYECSVSTVRMAPAASDNITNCIENPLLSSEEQIQKLVDIECARALEKVKSRRIPFVPNYASTDYFQRRTANYAEKLFEEIILWNKYQEMENKHKRMEHYEVNLKSLEKARFPVLNVGEIVKGIPSEDESKQLPRPNPKKTVEEKPAVLNKPKEQYKTDPISTDFPNFGFGNIGAFEQLGAIGKKLTAAITEPAKAVAQMTIDFVEAELNARDRMAEEHYNFWNKVKTVNPTELVSKTGAVVPANVEIEVAKEALSELNAYLRNPNDYEDEDNWSEAPQPDKDFDYNYESDVADDVILEIVSEMMPTAPVYEELDNAAPVEEAFKLVNGNVYQNIPTDSEFEDDWSAPNDSGISGELEFKDNKLEILEPAAFDELFAKIDWENMPMPDFAEECNWSISNSSNSEEGQEINQYCPEESKPTGKEESFEMLTDVETQQMLDNLEDELSSTSPIESDEEIIDLIVDDSDNDSYSKVNIRTSTPSADKCPGLAEIAIDIIKDQGDAEELSAPQPMMIDLKDLLGDSTSADDLRAALEELSEDIDVAYKEEFNRPICVEDTIDSTAKLRQRANADCRIQRSSQPIAVPIAATTVSKNEATIQEKPVLAAAIQATSDGSTRLTVIILLYVFTFILIFFKFI